MVPTSNPRRLKDLSTTTHDAEIMLVVLVADEFFIEITSPIKNVFSPTAVDDSINESFVIRIVRARPSHSERRMKDSANGPLFVSLSCCPHRATHIIGTSFA